MSENEKGRNMGGTSDWVCAYLWFAEPAEKKGRLSKAGGTGGMNRKSGGGERRNKRRRASGRKACEKGVPPARVASMLGPGVARPEARRDARTRERACHPRASRRPRVSHARGCSGAASRQANRSPRPAAPSVSAPPKSKSDRMQQHPGCQRRPSAATLSVVQGFGGRERATSRSQLGMVDSGATTRKGPRRRAAL